MSILKKENISSLTILCKIMLCFISSQIKFIDFKQLIEFELSSLISILLPLLCFFMAHICSNQFWAISSLLCWSNNRYSPATILNLSKSTQFVFSYTRLKYRGYQNSEKQTICYNYLFFLPLLQIFIELIHLQAPVCR